MDPQSPQMRPRTHGSVAHDRRSSITQLAQPTNSHPRNIHIQFDDQQTAGVHMDSSVFETLDREAGEQVLAGQRRPRAFSISQNSELQDTLHETGREPGVDLNALELDIHQECTITVTDYSFSRYEVHGPFTNEQFLRFMDVPQPAWSRVRWINVNGMDYNVLRRLSNTYKFHQLSVEDSLHFPTRTKIDRYAEHAYLCLPLLLLLDDQDESQDDEDETFGKFVSGNLFPCARAATSRRQITNLYRNSEYQTTLREYYYPRSSFNRSVLQNSEVGVEQTSIFFTDRVVVSIFEHSASIIAAPVMKRIVAGSSLILRTSESVEQLVHAIVDCIVDQHELVITAFQDHLASLEYNVLETPSRDAPKELHMLKADISLLRRTVVHILAVVNDFRNNVAMLDNGRRSRRVFQPTMDDDDAAEPLSQLAEDFLNHQVTHHHRISHMRAGEAASGTGQGTRSAAAASTALSPPQHLKSNRVSYWADVRDHLLSNMDHIDSMVSLCDTLANHIFQYRGARQNDIMRQLTTTTIVFLPLTFMTGYFGMNFHGSWGALDSGPLYFWYIATPVTVFILAVISLPSVFSLSRAFAGYQERKRAREQATLKRHPSMSIRKARSGVRLFKRNNTMNSRVSSAGNASTNAKVGACANTPGNTNSQSTGTAVSATAGFGLGTEPKEKDLSSSSSSGSDRMPGLARSDSASSAERAIAAAASQHTNQQLHHSQLYVQPIAKQRAAAAAAAAAPQSAIQAFRSQYGTTRSNTTSILPTVTSSTPPPPPPPASAPGSKPAVAVTAPASAAISSQSGAVSNTISGMGGRVEPRTTVSPAVEQGGGSGVEEVSPRQDQPAQFENALDLGPAALDHGTHPSAINSNTTAASAGAQAQVVGVQAPAASTQANRLAVPTSTVAAWHVSPHLPPTPAAAHGAH